MLLTPDRAIQICTEIASDMEADVRENDGKEFNGRTVAEFQGKQNAAISALANLVKELYRKEVL